MDQRKLLALRSMAISIVALCDDLVAEADQPQDEEPEGEGPWEVPTMGQPV